MGLGSIVNSVVDKARDVVQTVDNTIRSTTRTAERIAPTVSQFSSAAENMTERLLGRDPVSGLTGTARNLVAPAVEAVTEGPLDDIVDAGRGFLDGFREAAGNFIDRAVDAGRTVIDATVAQVVGFGRSVIEGAGEVISGVGQILNPGPLDNLLRGDFAGAWNEFRDNAAAGLRDIGGGLVKGTVQALFDTAIVGFNGSVSTIQTLIGLEPTGRPLTEQETAALRSVYGDSIDYSQIRLKEGNLGIKNGMAPHTVGNTIYIPEGWLDPNSANYQANRDALLVHEAAHVWQFQNGGTDYIGESLWNQALGWLSGQSRNAAYDFETPIAEGKSWAELNPEQQAHLIEEAFRDGLFTDPNARLVYNGNDYTDYARAAIAEMQAGRGAP
jgi:hypothetical protein